MERQDLCSALEAIAPVTLEELDAVKLMNRIDRKFVLTEDVLLKVLREAQGKYRVLETESGKTTCYDTLYYDTPDCLMFRIHQAGRLPRRKVRIRTYLNSGATFLEVKRKNNHGRTKKKRIEIRREDGLSKPQAQEFVLAKSGFDPLGLEPKVRTCFERITLANIAMTERLTIDMNLKFENLSTGMCSCLEDAVILELKQDGRAASQMLRILGNLGVRPFRVSKYCIGTVLTDPHAKGNRFKFKVRKIEKITNKKLLKYVPQSSANL